jgi:ornithine cyclodeaminase
MDGTEITYWRTSADSALGSRLLSRENAQTLLVVGAGAMSRWLVRAHMAVRPSLHRVLVWNRNADRGQELCVDLLQAGIAAMLVQDLNAATSDADIITCCTASQVPLIKGECLRPGTHLDLVGGYSEATREADDEAARRSKIFVDRRESAFHGVGDILTPIRNGTISETDVLGDLYDLIGKKIPGRQLPEDITFFKNAGGGHFDLIASEAIYRLVSPDEVIL